ncbi:MAG: VOC family protein [Beijerinckiaceae bacterium]|nr:VOC family protein [Beijerinckiaceae bacterium]
MNAPTTVSPVERASLSAEGHVALESEKAPVHIGSVSLIARDADALAGFYQDKIGLDVLRRKSGRVSLGSGGVAYLHLIASPNAKAPRQPAAGLFHTAFLLPSRAALGAWFTAAHDRGAPIEAASDHDVSEAFYLTDPEGNGIEVYADRDRSMWRKTADGYLMTTHRMDVHGVAEAGKDYAARHGASAGRFPAASRIGHVHLSVGEIDAAERFYHAHLGLDITHKRPGGSFFSSGGYHHHIATNTWHSLGACLREEGTTGLAEVELFVRDAALLAKLTESADAGEPHDSLAMEDPWGTRLSFSAG